MDGSDDGRSVEGQGEGIDEDPQSMSGGDRPESLEGSPRKEKKKKKKDKKEKKEKKSKKEKKEKREVARKRRRSDESDEEEPAADMPSKRKKLDALPNAPKKPLGAYFLFLATIREQVKQENPSASTKEIAQIQSKLWAELPAGEKEGFHKQADEEREAYKRAMAIYEQSEEYQQAVARGDVVPAGKGGKGRRKKGEQEAEKEEKAPTPQRTVYKAAPVLRLEEDRFLKNFDVSCIPNAKDRQYVENWLKRLEALRCSTQAKLTEPLLRETEKRLVKKLKHFMERLRQKKKFEAATGAEDDRDVQILSESHNPYAGEGCKQRLSQYRSRLSSNPSTPAPNRLSVHTLAPEVLEELQKQREIDLGETPKRHHHASHTPRTPHRTLEGVLGHDTQTGAIDGDPDTAPLFELPMDSDDEGEVSEATVSLWRTRPADPLGLVFAEDDGGPGLLVDLVRPSTPATRCSERLPGARVLQVNGHPVRTAEDVEAAARGKSGVSLRIRRAPEPLSRRSSIFTKERAAGGDGSAPGDDEALGRVRGWVMDQEYTGEASFGIGDTDDIEEKGGGGEGEGSPGMQEDKEEPGNGGDGGNAPEEHGGTAVGEGGGEADGDEAGHTHADM